MPKFKRRYRPRPDQAAIERFHNAMQEVTAEDVAEFISTMKRCKHGSLTRVFDDGTRITIFKDKFGRGYKLCIVEGSTPFFPQEVYNTEEEAGEALMMMLDAAEIEWRLMAVDIEIKYMDCSEERD